MYTKYYNVLSRGIIYISFNRRVNYNYDKVNLIYTYSMHVKMPVSFKLQGKLRVSGSDRYIAYGTIELYTSLGNNFNMQQMTTQNMLRNLLNILRIINGEMCQ